MIRREFLTLVGSITSITGIGSNAQPGTTADWSLTCDGETCAVVVFGRVAPSCSTRRVSARVSIDDDDTRTITDVIQPNAQAYCVTLLADTDELYEDTIELLGVEVSDR